MRGLTPLLGGLAALTLVAGCSGAGRPTAPASLPDQARNPIANPENGAPLFQATLALDPATMQAELLPARNPALDFPVDITGYLAFAPCADCFQLAGIGQGANGTVDLRFGIRHPFTPVLRPDLDVFDIRLIVGLPGETSFDRLPRAKDGGTVKLTNGAVVNADGFTAHFADIVTTPVVGAMNPYVDFFTESNPSATINGPAIPFHEMAAGAPMDYKLVSLDPVAIGNNPVLMNLLVEAHYGQAATKPTRFTPVYRNPQFNRKEAYAFRAIVQGNTLKEGEPTSGATLRLEVEDWQAGATIGVGTGEVDNPSDLARVVVDLPGIAATVLEDSTPDSGSGTAADPYIFTFALDNSNGAVAGTYIGAAMAEDEFDPFVTDFEYRVYQTFVVDVAPVDPIGCIGAWDLSSAASQVASQPGLSYLWPKEGVAIDSSSIAHIVWSDDSTGTDRAYYARQTAAGSGIFTAAEDFAGGSGASLYPTIAITPGDRVLVAWEDSRDHINGQEVYFSSRPASGGAWVLPLRVQESLALGENVFALFPKVAAVDNDLACLVWSDNRRDPEPFPFGSADFGLFFAQIESFVTPTVLGTDIAEDGPTSEGFPNLVVGNGRVHVAYQENVLDASGTRHLFHTSALTGPLFAGFDTPTRITAQTFDAGQPDIAMDLLGNLHVVYSHGGVGSNEDNIELTTSIDLGQTWAPSEQVSTGGTDEYNQVVPDIATDSLGNIHIVWHEFTEPSGEPGRVQYRRKSCEALWADVEFLTAPGTLAAFPSIALHGNGRSLGITFQQFAVDNYEIFYKTGTFLPPP